MFSNFAMSEMLVIALVAIIVIGPKELPGMLRGFGNVLGKIKKMAREFQGQIDDAIRDSELDGVSTSAFQPMEDAKKSMEKIQNAMANPLDAHKAVVSDELTEAAAEAELGPETAKLKKEIQSKAASTKSAAAKRAAEKKAPPKKAAPKTAAKAPAKKAAPKKTASRAVPKKRTAAAKKPAAKAKATS